MKISIKTVIALIVTAICLILILNFVSNSVIQTNFSKIETEQVTETIGDIQVAVTNRNTQIDTNWSLGPNLTAHTNLSKIKIPNINKHI